MFFNFRVKFMKFFISLVTVLGISLASMQVAIANVSEKKGVQKSTVSTNKALSHVVINPFVDQQRLEKAEAEKPKIDSKIAEKKRFIREGHVVKYKSVA